MSLNPFDQFTVRPLINLSILEHDISFTNASLFMMTSVLVISLFLYLASRNASIIPNKLQGAAELLFEFVDNTLTEAAGKSARVFFPFVFTLFTFLLILNVSGLLPYGYTVTSQLVITFALAILVFIAVIITGFIKHGIGFLSMFLPKGTPIYIAPLMILIELFSFLVRPISLCIRLAGNMVAGHVLLKVLGTFAILMGAAGLLPILFMVIMVGFELFVAILQAYIFTILTCVYLNDAINLH
ncbi:MAG: F0F1 ATP synthase subunit A [Rickettsiales bacterium]